MAKYILHDSNYDSYEFFDEEPTSEELDEFVTNHSEDVDNITVYVVKKTGEVKKQLSIIYDDKCKDC